MDLLGISLISSITLCSLVSGFIFTYSIVVMPGLSNLNDKDFLKGSKFVQYLLTKGIYFHPWHNMFLSLAHTVEDVSTTLDAVEFAMKKISEEF